MAAKRLRNVALGVGAAWACWWVSFETAEAMGDGQFTQAILFLVAMFGAVALAWKWPAIGGALFVAEGVAAVILFSPAWRHDFRFGPFLLLFAIMPLPPLVAGALLLLSRRPTHQAAHLPV